MVCRNVITPRWQCSMARSASVLEVLDLKTGSLFVGNVEIGVVLHAEAGLTLRGRILRFLINHSLKTYCDIALAMPFQLDI